MQGDEEVGEEAGGERRDEEGGMMWELCWMFVEEWGMMEEGGVTRG